MTVGVEIRLPWLRRLRMLFGGSLYVTINLKPSWYVHLEASSGQAWEYHDFGNRMINDVRVFANNGQSYAGCTVCVEERNES